MGINDAYRGVNAFITGSNRGLGYGFARHLLKYPISNVFAGFRDFDNAKVRFFFSNFKFKKV